MESPDLPECPVCLQQFDGEDTTPRVLACGHSVCETCLIELPKPFPRTLRCPACTQLVHYPNQGPSALPKNIDLLRLCSSLSKSPTNGKPARVIAKREKVRDFVAGLWGYEFYVKWKDWVIEKDTILVEKGGDVGISLRGRVGDLGGQLPARCLMKCGQEVSLVKVGTAMNEDGSGFKYGYVANVMRVLHMMKDGELDELGAVLRASLTGDRICTAYGLWCDEGGDKSVYLVFERYRFSFLKDLTRGSDFVGDGVFRFAMIGTEICEAMALLLKEGLVAGCVGLSCFAINDFGHVFIDLSQILVLGGRIRRTIKKAMSHFKRINSKELEVSLKDEIREALVFVSPELLVELLQNEGIVVASACSRKAVGYASDVWSLGCLLIWLLVGNEFIEDANQHLCHLILSAIEKSGSDFEGLYIGWMARISTYLDHKLGLEFFKLKELLQKCLDLDPDKRPHVVELWNGTRDMTSKCEIDIMDPSKVETTLGDKGHCLLHGELCQLISKVDKILEKSWSDGLQKEDGNAEVDDCNIEELEIQRDISDSLCWGLLKSNELKHHIDCITGLAVGGGFLFSSSFDRTVNVWSLQDCSHIHSFKGHENRVMALVFVDGEQPLCISGDSGGGILLWGIKVPFEEEPIKRLYEEKDWRYSGIHALAVSGNSYFYTGSGDKSIKAWSLRDYTLSCIMTGHKSVVTTLAISDGVLYSGSRDGTLRLWSLSDHSPLTTLGEDGPGSLSCGSVLSLAADEHTLVAAYENGCIKIWGNDILQKSTLVHKGAIFGVGMEGKWLFTGGWNKIVIVHELSRDEAQVDAIQIGSISCDSVITTLLYWKGMLFIGLANGNVKVYFPCASFGGSFLRQYAS